MLDPDPHTEGKVGFGLHLSQNSGVLESKKGAVDVWRLKMKPWRLCRPVVTNSHNFDEEQDPKPELEFLNNLWGLGTE
jgi:hypothetical protein